MGKFKIFQALEKSSSLQSGVAKTKQILRNACELEGSQRA